MKKKMLAGLTRGLMKNTFLIIALLLLFFVDVQASITTDFSWIPSGTSNTGTTTLPDGTVITLNTSPIPFDDYVLNSARVFSLNDPSPAIITLNFNRTIKDLRLLVDDLDPSLPETLDSFSTVPTYVDGFLSLNTGVVTSLQQDSGGNLFWDELNSSSITFTFNRNTGCGLHLNELEVTPVPLPASLWILGSGLACFLGIKKKKNRYKSLTE